MSHGDAHVHNTKKLIAKKMETRIVDMCGRCAYKWLSSVDVYIQVSVRKSLLFMPGNFLLMMLRIAAISSAATVRTT